MFNMESLKIQGIAWKQHKLSVTIEDVQIIQTSISEWKGSAIDDILPMAGPSPGQPNIPVGNKTSS